MGSRREYAYLYKTKQWKRLRENQLRKHPRCQCPLCKEQGDLATVVDHVQPHKGDRKKFYDPRNLQSMSKAHHDRHKQSQEKGGIGFSGACDVNGEPFDPQDQWFK